MNCRFLSLLLAGATVLCPDLMAQHLWWNLEGQGDATCLYGEITVLATPRGSTTAAQTGIRANRRAAIAASSTTASAERRTIFSIWDTSPQLHPKTTEADPRTVFDRFGGEGEGGHTHMIWPWKTNETFQFFVGKQPGGQPDTTDTRYYVYDREKRAVDSQRHHPESQWRQAQRVQRSAAA